MYRYLFTNDLRISKLDASLQKAGHCFLTDTVPSSKEDKSANNNMKTLAFYFNLSKDSRCAKEAAEGNIRAVVFNFIKKFQFPNMRTNEAFKNCLDDKITIAPMRVIIKVLYTMNLLYGSFSAYLTRDEIKYFIFYNDAVAKNKNPKLTELIDSIIEYRKTGQFPPSVSLKEEDHEWKQEDRQIREIVKVLKWSGCVTETEDRISIFNESLSLENKAAIYDIVNYQKFWNGTTIESYREYMDISEDEIAFYGNQRYIDETVNEECISVEQLSKILMSMASKEEIDKATSVQVFGIKYGKEILENNYELSEIISGARMEESYAEELKKALDVCKCIKENTFGLTFERDDLDIEINNEERIKFGENLLFYGVPGSGKSYAVDKICSDERFMERVVFHPDYTYSDFVGQILPRLNKENKLEYVFNEGPFTRILMKAYEDPQNMYYLVIEEINRGNAPAIFGEIFQLLDRDEEGTSEYGISNFEVADKVYKNPSCLVKLVSNLSIIATMNTSDQNVFTLDTAFQRRWKMKHIPNSFENDHAKDLIKGSKISWGAFATVINDMVTEENMEFVGSGDKRLGAYFAKINELEVDTFPEKVLKYLWDDAFKMDKALVFDEKFKSLDNVIETYENDNNDKLKAVLRMSVYNKMTQKMNIDQTNDVEGE